jgi:hypothetical protein
MSNERTPKVGASPEGYAATLWTLGSGHVLALEQLLAAARKEAPSHGLPDSEAMAFNGGLSPSIHLLTGYALELLLKAAIVHHGGTEADLRKVGHDLPKALDLAEALGFKAAAANLRWVAEGMAQAHRDHQFRYGALDEVDLPPLSVTEKTLEALTLEVGVIVNEWQIPPRR